MYSSSSYTPTYYTSLHDSIASICKSVLPFSFKKRRLPAILSAEQKLSKQQSDNLKWQQDSFHQILKLMGLAKEGIIPETEVSVFRTHLLNTLIASPPEIEIPAILKDKLLFLQDLLYAKCITDEEYHSFKKPLLQRLAVQGAEIEARNVIVSAPKERSDGEWSVIDLKEESCLLNSNKSNSNSNPKSASSLFTFKSPLKSFKDAVNPREVPISVSKNELGLSKENPFWDIDISEEENENGSILMTHSSPPEKISERKKAKQKSFKTLFQKWKKSDTEDETAPLPLSEKSDSPAFSHSNNLVPNGPLFVGPDTRQIKMKLHSNGSSSDFFVDKVLGENLKKELRRIQSELSATNANLHFSNDQLEAISTQLPVDKTDLKKLFPKSWCDQYGEVVLDVVKKEFKNHVSEMGNLQNSANIEKKKKNKKKKDNNGSSKKWTTFEGNEENSHPNIINNSPYAQKQKMFAAPSKLDKSSFLKNSNNNNNPFLQDYDHHHEEEEGHLHNHNPFWTPPSHGSSMIK